MILASNKNRCFHMTVPTWQLSMTVLLGTSDEKNNGIQYHWKKFLDPNRSHSYLGFHVNKPNFPLPINALLDQKCSISSQPIPNIKQTLWALYIFPCSFHPKQDWLFHPKQDWLWGLANQIFSILLLLVFYSLS